MSENTGISEQEYAERRARLGEKLREQGIDALFVAPSSDLEYLTGLERDLPSFGNVHYAHGWVTGALIAPDRDPVYILPRMYVTFHLWGRDIGEVVTVKETDDGSALFRQAVGALGSPKRIAVGARTWGEAVIELGRCQLFRRETFEERNGRDEVPVGGDVDLGARARGCHEPGEPRRGESPQVVVTEVWIDPRERRDCEQQRPARPKAPVGIRERSGRIDYVLDRLSQDETVEHLRRQGPGLRQVGDEGRRRVGSIEVDDVSLLDPVVAELDGVPRVLDLRHGSPDVISMFLQKLRDEVPVDGCAAVVPVPLAERGAPTQVAPARPSSKQRPQPVPGA